MSLFGSIYAAVIIAALTGVALEGASIATGTALLTTATVLSGGALLVVAATVGTVAGAVLIGINLFGWTKKG